MGSRFRTIVHPPVEVDRSLDKEPFILDAVGQYVALLERCALESPSNWEIWALMA